MITVQTLIGEVEESLLTKNVIMTGDDEWNTCYAVEWFHVDRDKYPDLVRRDVEVVVKKTPSPFGLDPFAPLEN